MSVSSVELPQLNTISIMKRKKQKIYTRVLPVSHHAALSESHQLRLNQQEKHH